MAKSLGIKDLVVFTLARNAKIGEDGKINVEKGFNRICYKLASWLIGGEDHWDDYTMDFLDKMTNCGIIDEKERMNYWKEIVKHKEQMESA